MSSYLFPTSFPKVRQEGFHTQQSSSSSSSTPGPQSGPQRTLAAQPQAQQSFPAPNAFDPNAIYTTGALFAAHPTTADPFARRFEQQQQSQQPHAASLDIHDELSFLNPPTSATSESFQHPRPHDIFGVNQQHYPSLSLPPSRALYPRDDFNSTTAASLHNSYGRSDYFPPNQQQQHAAANNQNATGTPSDGTRHPNDLTPQQQQQQQQQQFGLVASAIGNPNTPLDNFNPGGEQAATTGVTRSRSRSRSKVSASRSRVSKRPSIAAAPPREEGDESPDQDGVESVRSRPSAIVIPGHPGHHQHHNSQHSFSSYHTAGGTHPTSPATWGFSHGADGQSYAHSFGTPGTLGPGQSPTAHSGSPPPSANQDAAAKLALANEKRRKRRESHNAVERRRRDNINEKIQELAMLLPEEWLDQATVGGNSGAKGGANGNGFGGPSIAGILSGTVSGAALGGDEDTKEIKANKGVILRNSVEYIKNLVQLVQVQRTRNQQLESELAQYRNRFGNMMGVSNGGNMALGGSGMSPPANGNVLQAGGANMNTQEDDANGMVGFLSSPDAFAMKNIFANAGIGPLETLGTGGAGAGMMQITGMEGIETSPGAASTLGSGMHMNYVNFGGASTGLSAGASPNAQSQGGQGPNNTSGGGGNGGLPAMLIDATSPSTGSGENDEQEDDDRPRGRATTRFPAGVGKHEEDMPTL